MQFVYAYETAQDGDSMLVSFPDVSGATTAVGPGEDFDELVRDALIAALGGYIELGQPLPKPTPVRQRPSVSLGVLESAKIALASAMVEAKVSNAALARSMGVSEKIVRRMLDLDHTSRIDRLEAALALFDKKLEVSVRPNIRTDNDFAVTHP